MEREMDMRASAQPATPDAATLIRLHRSALRRFLLRRLRDNPHDADDLTQDVCLRFLLCYRGQPLCRPLAYLCRIAIHALHDLNSRRKREQRMVLTDSEVVDQLLELCPGAQGDPANSIAARDHLQSVLKRLSPSHKAVLLAHKGEGLSYVEVARETGLSIHTVEKYLTQAKAQLRSTGQVAMPLRKSRARTARLRSSRTVSACVG